MSVTFSNVKQVIKNMSIDYPALFISLVKWMVVCNVFVSVIGGMLWILIWNAANSIDSSYQLYYHLQPLSNVPEWMAHVVSLAFTLSIVINTVAFLFFAAIYIKDKNWNKI